MEVVRALVFGTSISVTSIFTARFGHLGQDNTSRIPLRPPSWVFGVVWPILFGTTGVAWILAGSKADVSLAIVTTLCCSWLVLYVALKWKAIAAFALVGTVIATTFAALYLKGVPGWLLSPLSVWTAFATYLNVYELYLNTVEESVGTPSSTNPVSYRS